MNIKSGTRVRNTEDEFPHLTNGTYKGREGKYYLIDWDNTPPLFGYSLHLANEFEVI